MIAAAQEHNVLLSIEHTRRWHPLYHAARNLILSGEIGALRTVVANQLGPRSMLFRNGTHIIDLICFFAGSSPQWVWAELEAGFDHFETYRGDGGHDPNAEPAASAYVHFANGIRAFYNGAKTAYPAIKLELYCENGHIEISDQGAYLTCATPRGRLATSPIVANPYSATMQLAAVAELVQILEQGGQLISSAQEARKSLEIMLSILTSHAKGNARVDLPAL
jgi:predicted dehydrogenase